MRVSCCPLLHRSMPLTSDTLVLECTQQPRPLCPAAPGQPTLEGHPWAWQRTREGWGVRRLCVGRFLLCRHADRPLARTLPPANTTCRSERLSCPRESLLQHLPGLPSPRPPGYLCPGRQSHGPGWAGVPTGAESHRAAHIQLLSVVLAAPWKRRCRSGPPVSWPLGS